MGWLWNSPKINTSDQSHLQNSNRETPTDSLSAPDASSSDISPPPSIIDEAPNPDLDAFLTALRPPPPKEQPSHNLPHDSNSESDLITPRHIHPTTLSCRSAFDTAFYCASLGGQFTSLYRYGSLRPCSQQWSDFWFCIRTNRGLYSDEEKEMRVLKHEWAKEKEKYGRSGGDAGGEVHVGVGVGGVTRGLSSEDVWEQRERLVRGAFEGDYWGAVEEERKAREGRS
ncbi:hypothetical protein ACLMJK_002215 [Lecanora helva]